MAALANGPGFYSGFPIKKTPFKKGVAIRKEMVLRKIN
jgi:hypothetical protein